MADYPWQHVRRDRGRDHPGDAATVAGGRPTDLPYTDCPPPASPKVIQDAERIFGYPLPPLARRMYAEVANGGVGPSGGIQGLDGGYGSNGDTMVEEYLLLQESDRGSGKPPLPAGVLIFCDFGCAMYSFLDCRHPDGQMWWCDQGDRVRLNLTLRQWLTAWLEGHLDNVRAAPNLMLPDET